MNANAIAGVIAQPSESVRGTPHAQVRHAAQEFESMMVKQMLTVAKMGGSENAGGYAEMAVDAMATQISRAGGLGLTDKIAEALERTMRATVQPGEASGVGSGGGVSR